MVGVGGLLARLMLRMGGEFWNCLILRENQQGSRSARLSPQSMIHYAHKLFKCSMRKVKSLQILETTR